MISRNPMCDNHVRRWCELAASEVRLAPLHSPDYANYEKHLCAITEHRWWLYTPVMHAHTFEKVAGHMDADELQHFMMLCCYLAGSDACESLTIAGFNDAFGGGLSKKRKNKSMSGGRFLWIYEMFTDPTGRWQEPGVEPLNLTFNI